MQPSPHPVLEYFHVSKKIPNAHLLSFKKLHSSGYEVYLIVVLICISWWILSMFHVSDYSSVFFCAMSFQVFCPFIKLCYLSFCYWLVGFHIYSVYESLVGVMYHEYFSRFVAYLFIWLIVYFDKQKFNFWLIWFVNFFSYDYYFLCPKISLWVGKSHSSWVPLLYYSHRRLHFWHSWLTNVWVFSPTKQLSVTSAGCPVI